MSCPRYQSNSVSPCRASPEGWAGRSPPRPDPGAWLRGWRRRGPGCRSRCWRSTSLRCALVMYLLCISHSIFYYHHCQSYAFCPFVITFTIISRVRKQPTAPSIIQPINPAPKQQLSALIKTQPTQPRIRNQLAGIYRKTTTCCLKAIQYNPTTLAPKPTSEISHQSPSSSAARKGLSS